MSVVVTLAVYGSGQPRRGPAVFVGRGNDLSRLLAALGADTRLVLVAGGRGRGQDPVRHRGDGPGRRGRDRDGGGECLPLASTLPLLPVADALGELARLEDGRLLAAALEATPPFVREEIGRLLPRHATTRH